MTSVASVEEGFPLRQEGTISQPRMSCSGTSDTIAKPNFLALNTSVMYRNASRSSGRTASGSRHLSKQMLLPISRQSASDMSLRSHLALAVCRRGNGNAYLMNELVKTVYTTYYLQRSGLGDAPVELFCVAESGLERALAEASVTQVWTLGEDAASSLEEVLALHDQQLVSAAAWMLVDARERLDAFVASDRHSPFSD